MMKTKTTLFAIALLALASCAKIGAGKLEDNLVDGTWRAKYYIHDGAKEISKLLDRTFTFSADGKVTVSSSTENVTGTWKVVTKSAFERTKSPNKYTLSIDLGAPFENLKMEWYVKYNNEKTVELFQYFEKDAVSPDLPDLLTFEKK